jgi:vitamin B12 transporter
MIQAIDTAPIVITAARTPEEQGDVAASVTILDEQRISRLGEPLVTDLLRLTPSAAIAVSGSAGSQTQLRIRGSEANHTLLFVDGIRANDPAAANEPRFELLNADIASRIEVVRGPQSALWGSEAIGGVVAVDGAAVPDPTASIEAGSFGFARGSAAVGVDRQPLTVAFGGGYQRSAGIDAFGDAAGDRDGYWNLALRGRAALAIGPHSEIGVNGFAIRAHNDFDGYGPPFFDHVDTLDNTKNQLSAGRAWFSHKDERWTATLAASLLGSSNRNYLDETYLNRTSATRSTLSGQLSRRFETGQIKHELTAALDGEWERYRASDVSMGGGTNQHRSRRHLAVTGEWRADYAGWLVADLALRRDAFNRFKDATTVRASALAKVGGGFTLAGSWGEGIAQPTFVDLYGFFPNSFVGNPDLKPERSRGYELSARYARGPVSASLTWFRQSLKDEIVENATFTSTLNASGTSRRKGIEAELGWRPGLWLALSAGYAWLDAIQQVVAGTDPVREQRRPRHSGFVAADGTSGRLSYSASLAYTGRHRDRRDSFPYELVDLDPYWLASARLAYRLDDRLELFGRVHNAFDADYEDVVRYRTEGRSAFAGLRIAFGR